MKRKLLVLLSLTFSLFSNAQIEVEVNASNYEFYSESVLKPGEYLAKGYTLDTKFKLVNVSLNEMVFFHDEFYSVDSSILLKPTEVSIIDHRGKVRAKGEIEPYLLRLEDQPYETDTEFIEDEFGDLMPVVIGVGYRDTVNIKYLKDYKFNRTGKWEFFNFLGNKVAECKYKNGLPINGKDWHWKDQGEAEIKEYKEGKCKSLTLYYYGFTYYHEKYNDRGNKEGLTITYNRDSIAYQKVNYINGKANGEFFELARNSIDTVYTGSLLEDEKHGKWKYWELNDDTKKFHLSHTGEYFKGHPVGIHSYYDTANVLIRRKEFKIVKKDSSFSHLKSYVNGFHIPDDSIFSGLISDSIFSSKGNLIQVTIFNPIYRKSKSNYEVLDGLYIREHNQIFYNPYKFEVSSDPDWHYSPLQQSNYDSNGALLSATTFFEGKPYEGKYIKYFSNGSVSSLESYSQGEKHGASYKFSLEGDTTTIESFWRGVEHGEMKGSYYNGFEILGIRNGKATYKRNGKVTSIETNWVDKTFGHAKYFHKNGNLHKEGEEVGWGKKRGEWKFYDTLGNFTHSENYIDNELLGVQEREAPTFFNTYNRSEYQYFNGEFVKSMYSCGVFGTTVPEGKVTILNWRKDTVSIANFQQNLYNDVIPEIEFKEIDKKSFTWKCDFYEPLKTGKEIKDGNEFFHHKAYADSTFYFWTMNVEGEITESYKIRLFKDLRFFKYNDVNQTIVYAGRGYRSSINNYISHHGEKTVYGSNGKIKSVYYLKGTNHEFIGPRSFFYKDGQLKMKGLFLGNSETRGIGIGLHNYYNEKGQLRKKVEFTPMKYTINLFGEKEELLFSQEYVPAEQGRYSWTMDRPKFRTWKNENPHLVNGKTRFFSNGILVDSLLYEIGELKEGKESSEKKKWSSFNGPIGCDATSFYVDEGGKYWLGTGSSGGVFTSSNQGKSWKSLNQGIGPIHVVLMGEMKGEMYLIKQTPNEVEEAYKLNNKKWELINDKRTHIEIKDSLNRIRYLRADTNYRSEEKFIGKWSRYNSYWLENGQNNYYFDSELSTPSIPFSGENTPLLFTQSSGNQWQVSHDKTIVFGKSGVYEVDSLGIKENEYKGLVASDVKEIFIDSKDVVWTVIGIGDVWSLVGKKWVQVFDVHKEWLKDTAQSILYNTNNLEEVNGRVRFSALGKVYELVNGHFAVKIEKPENESILCYSEDENGYVSLNAIDEVNDETKFRFFCHSTLNGNDTIYALAGRPSNTFLKKSPTGEIWLFSPDEIINLQTETRYPLNWEFNNGTLTTNHVTFKANGDFAFMQSDEEILLYRNGVFETKYVQQLKGATSIAYLRGELYGGTGFNFAPSCGLITYGKSHGLYKLKKGAYWSKIQNCPNPWIMSLIEYKGYLLVGTSGSGLWKLK